MSLIALEWLPVGVGLAASLTGLLGLGSALVPRFRTKHTSLAANSALYLVAGVLLLLPVFGFLRERIAAAVTPALVPVEIGLTSDPEGAEVYLDGIFVGYTPITFQRPQGATVFYRIQAGEAVPDAAIYEDFEGEMVVEEAVTVSVWLDRKPLGP